LRSPERIPFRQTALPGVLLLVSRVLRDERGAFRETWRAASYGAAGVGPAFVQDNASVSLRGVVRGLHYQHPQGQGKLVSVLRGAVWDVALDVRRGSPAFGRWTAHELSDGNGHQLWIPAGFAHGFATLTDEAVVSYRCTEYYDPDGDETVRWDDPALGIPWPVREAKVSDKDGAAPLLARIPADRLPPYPISE
jgi:dTDP-4-dehydrorhamnose 3,5-epimerase